MVSPYKSAKAGLHPPFSFIAIHHHFRIVFLINQPHNLCFSELTDILLCGLAGTDNLRSVSPLSRAFWF